MQLAAPLGQLVVDFSGADLDTSEASSMTALLTSGLIALTVTNDESGVSYNLTEGTLVNGAPAAAGEYALSANEEGTAVTIAFYNSFDGKTIRLDGAYTAAIDVTANDYFTVEMFSVGVTVTE